MNHTCPDCGQTFSTKRGLRSHFGIKHDGPYPDRVEICAECDREFRGRPGSVNKYCSQECKNEALRERSNDSHPFYDKRRVECEWCGEVDHVAPSRASTYRFCSRECQGEWQSAERTGASSSNWKGGIDRSTSVCEECGKLFEYKTGGSNGRFCSHDCYHGYHVGENHSQWVGGEVSYHGRWKQQRRKAIERDGHACVLCGTPDEKHQRKYGRSLDVHHVMPYRAHDDPHEANRLDNLITLCRPCHRRWEGVPLKPQLTN